MPNFTLSFAEAQGLPSSTVYDVTVDNEGWLWVATAEGAYRYDGVDFIAYKSSVARHNQTHNFQFDRQGNMYVQNFRQQVFRVSADSLSLAYEFPYEAEMGFVNAVATPTSLLLLRAGSLIHSSKGNQILEAGDTPTNHFARVLSPTQELAVLTNGAPEVNGILIEEHFRVPPKHLTNRLFYTTTQFDNQPIALVKGNTNTIDWLPISYTETEKLRTTPHPAPASTIRRALQLPNGSLVLCTNTGVYQHNEKDNTWQTIADLVDASGVAVGRNGQLWISTLDQGLLLYTYNKIPAQQYSNLPQDITRLAVCDNGNLFAISRGFLLFQLKDDAKPIFCERLALAIYPSAPNLFDFGFDYSIDCTGNLYKKEQPFVDVSQVLFADTLGQRSRVFGTRSATYFSEPLPNHLSFLRKHIVDKPQTKTTAHKLKNGRSCGTAYLENQRRIVIANTSGITSYSAEGEQTVALPNGIPSMLTAYSNGVFIPTLGGGLYHAQDGDLNQLTRIEALSGQRITQIAFEQNTLWAASERGVNICQITQADPIKLDCKLADVHTGLPSGNATALTVNDGTAYIAYGRTVYRLDRGANVLNPKDKVHIPIETRLRVAGAEIDQNKVSLSETITLNANREVLQIYPRAPLYVAGATAQFRYRLLSLDSTWRYTSGIRPEIYFANLSPGKYNLEYALDAKDAQVQTLQIVAQQALYRRRWFQLTALLICLGFISYYFLQRSQRNARAASLEANLRGARLSAIAAQMNPHFVFNALNSIQEFVIDQDGKKANAYLSSFAQLMRLTLDHSRTTRVPIGDDIRAMRLYANLEALRLDGTVEVEFEVQKDLPKAKTIPPLLLQPFLENAFKHGILFDQQEAPKIKVSYSQDPQDAERLLIAVSDNGAGRKRIKELQRKSKNRTPGGFGLSASKRRIELLNEVEAETIRLEIQDLESPEKPTGTRVVLSVRMLKLKTPQDDKKGFSQHR